MTSLPSPSVSPQLARVERILAWGNAVVALALLALAVRFMVDAESLRGEGPHGGFFLFLGAMLLVPEAVFFALAALGMFRGAAWRWGAQLGPILAPLTFGAGITWLSR